MTKDAGARSVNDPVPYRPARTCRPGKPKNAVACFASA